MDGQLKYYDQRVQKEVRILANNNDRAGWSTLSLKWHRF